MFANTRVEANFDFGRVWAGAFRALGACWAPALFLTALGGWLPSLVVDLVQLPFVTPNPQTHAPLNWAVSVGYVVVLELVALFAQAVVGRLTFDALAGRRGDIGGALARSLTAAPALLPFFLIPQWAWIANLYVQSQGFQSAIRYAPWIGLASGLFNLVWSAHFAILPALFAVEGGRLSRAIPRASGLMRKGRWAYVAVIVTVSIVNLVTVFLRNRWMAQAITAHHGRTNGDILVQHLASLPNLALAAFVTVLTAAWYVEVRRLRDGLGAADAAEVFA